MTEQIHNISPLKETRQLLRNNATFAEQILWEKLKGKKLNGIKFRRQHSIENVIVDFYCPEFRLALEVDGGIHQLSEVQADDRYKEDVLRSHNIQLLRFTNEDVLGNINLVLKKIENSIV